MQVSLARGIAGGQIGALGTASRVGFVAGQSIAQVGSHTGGITAAIHCRAPILFRLGSKPSPEQHERVAGTWETMTASCSRNGQLPQFL